MNAAELTTFLSKDTGCTVFILTGTEHLLKEECTLAIRKHFEKSTGEKYELQPLFPQQSNQSADKLAVATVLDDLRSASLFGGRRLLVLHNATFFYSQAKEVLNRYFAAPSKRNVLVMEIATFRSTKALAAAGTVTAVACDAPFDSAPPWKSGGPEYDTPLAAWTVARAAKRYAKKMTKPVAFALTRRTGRSLERLDGELQKLVLYVGDREEIREKDVTEVAGHDRRGSLLKITDRFYKKDLAGTLSMLRLLFARGFTDRSGAAVADPAAIALIAVSMFHTEMRKLRKTKHALAQGFDTGAIMKALKFKKEFQLNTAKQRAGKWSDDQLLNLLDALVDLDLSVKSTGAAPEAMFERMIVSQIGFGAK